MINKSDSENAFRKNRFTGSLSKEKALQKIKHFCGYQERSHQEVKDKLYGMGLWKKDVEELLAQLIEENYLNEERFAILFAGGRFRIKQWGRIKIKYELKKKQVSEYCIRKALLEIDEDSYSRTLTNLAMKKIGVLKSEKNIFIKKRKLQDYLLQKGFEPVLVHKVTRDLI